MQAQRGDGGVAATHSKPGIRRRLVISTIFRPLCPQERDPVPVLQRALWASVLVWTGTEKLNGPVFDLRPSVDRI